MERFVIQQNIEHYRAMLKITTDLERRGVIEKLLLEEEAKLRKYGAPFGNLPPSRSLKASFAILSMPPFK